MWIKGYQQNTFIGGFKNEDDEKIIINYGCGCYCICLYKSTERN